MPQTYKRHRELSSSVHVSSSDYSDSSDYEEPARKRTKSNSIHVPFNEDQAKARQRQKKPLSKNALMARENRQRKKRYIAFLEDDVQKQKDEVARLTARLNDQTAQVDKLSTHVKYLKSLIFNSSQIGGLLRNIQKAVQKPHENVSWAKVHDVKPVNKQIPIAKKVPYSWENEGNSASIEAKVSTEDIVGHGNDPEGFSTSLFGDFLNDDVNFGAFDTSFESDLFSDPSINDVDLSCYKNTLQDHSYDDDFYKVGVCLHVKSDRVSVEFCAKCSESANLLNF